MSARSIITCVLMLGLLGGLTAAGVDTLQPSMPEEAVSELVRARELRRRGRFAEAARALEEVVRKHPSYYLALYNLGLSYDALGSGDRAADTLTAALAVRESEGLSTPYIYNTLGWVQLKQGDYAGAQKNLLVAAKYAAEGKFDDSTERRVYNNLGLLYLYIGNLDDAELYLTKALDLGSTSSKDTLLLVKNARQALTADKAPSAALVADVRWSVVVGNASIRNDDGKMKRGEDLRRSLLEAQERGGFVPAVESIKRADVSALEGLVDQVAGTQP